MQTVKGAIVGVVVLGFACCNMALAAPPGMSRTPPATHPGFQRHQNMEQTQMRMEQSQNRPGVQTNPDSRSRELQQQRQLDMQQHMDRSTVNTSVPSRGNAQVRSQAAGAAARGQQGREQGRHIQRSTQRPQHQAVPVPRNEPHYETIPQGGPHP